MNVNLGSIISVTEANQNFSKLEKLVEKNGRALVFKGNKPKFMMIDMNDTGVFEDVIKDLRDLMKEQKGAKNDRK